jgi:hypothetical protein
MCSGALECTHKKKEKHNLGFAFLGQNLYRPLPGAPSSCNVRVAACRPPSRGTTTRVSVEDHLAYSCGSVLRQLEFILGGSSSWLLLDYELILVGSWDSREFILMRFLWRARRVILMSSRSCGSSSGSSLLARSSGHSYELVLVGSSLSASPSDLLAPSCDRDHMSSQSRSRGARCVFGSSSS